MALAKASLERNKITERSRADSGLELQSVDSTKSFQSNSVTKGGAARAATWSTCKRSLDENNFHRLIRRHPQIRPLDRQLNDILP